MQILNNRLYGSYLNMTFADVYSDYEEFAEDAKGMAAKLIPADFTDDSLEVLYYLLLSKYANNSIASSDVNRFKLHLFSIVYQHGGAWQKKVELQIAIRTIQDKDAREGDRRINNHAYNPATPASTASLEDLQYIDQQDQSGRKKGQLETYAQIKGLIEDDFTEEFLERFKVLFSWFVSPQRPLWYITTEDERELMDEVLTNENL